MNVSRRCNRHNLTGTKTSTTTTTTNSMNKLQLDVHSSMASGLAAVFFDILLLGLIKSHAQVLCAIANLHLVYDRRRPIHPTISRFGFLAGGPVGPIQLSRVFSILILLSTACVIVIGFCINGTTVSRYEPRMYSSVVTMGKKPISIDYDKAAPLSPTPSPSGDQDSDAPASPQKVARKLVGLSDTYSCMRTNYGYSTLYGYAYRDTLLDYDPVDISKRLEGGECLVEENFRHESISRSYNLSLPTSDKRCDLSSLITSFPDGSAAQGSATIRTDDRCDINILDNFRCCRRPLRTSCATIGSSHDRRKKDFFVLLTSNVGDNEKFEDVQIVQINSVDKEDYEKYLTVVAFLSAVGFGGGLANLANMAISDVAYNRTLDKDLGKVDVTEIDLVVALPALVVVLVTTLLLSILAVVMWVRVVYAKRRLHYNTFVTVPDILDMVQAEKISRRKDRGGDKPFIGVRVDHPGLAVCSEEQCCGAPWSEEEIH